jgi:hypothetical protein
MANHFLGFDLGHADTAIALVSGDSRDRFAAPANLEIHGQVIQPTALIRQKGEGNEELIVGTRAIREAAKSEGGSEKAALKAAFKARPNRLGEARRDISGFFAACLEGANFDPVPPEGWAGVEIAVGCPSSWSAEEDIKQYQELLVEGISRTPMKDARVRVVPESRAALLQAIDSPNSPLTAKARDENILVIDIGSSTLDFSLIAPERKAAPLLDAGLDLGASFFDRQVLEANLEREGEARRFLHHNPHYRDLWLYYARRTKEQFFLDAPTDPTDRVSGAPLQPYFTGGRRRSLEITTSGEEMARFERAPYDLELHPSAELNLDPLLLEGKSWTALYEESLRALKAAIERRGTGFGQVLLAGGASRMPFTKQLAERVFGGNGEVLRDPEPSHLVSRGLARWGRKRHDVERFSKEAAILMQERLPALVEQEFPALKASLASGMADLVFDRFVVPVVEDWKDGAFKTGQDVRREIERNYRAWLPSAEAESFFIERINGWWRDHVKHALDEELDDLHTQYGISRDIQLQFDRAIEPGVFGFKAEAIELPFETIIQIILVTLAYVVTLSIDAALGGIPFLTGGLTAAVFLGGRFTRRWIASLDVPAFARRLPDRLPGRDKLFSGQIKAKVEKALSSSLDRAEESILDQVKEAVAASVRNQTRRAQLLLMGGEGGLRSAER